MATTRESLDDFLAKLRVDIPTLHNLAKKFSTTYTFLAAQSQDQFLPTPISDSVLRSSGEAKGRYLAIDIGGTNLRVGFIELLGHKPDRAKNGSLVTELSVEDGSRVVRHLEKSWPIGEQLKQNKDAEDLFQWIGKCMVEVVQDGCKKWPGEMHGTIPLGVTFSFPMIQHTLSDATLMAMGKGFAITSKLDLGKQLQLGYENARTQELPQIEMTAIANDTVSTLISFTYQYGGNPRHRPAMGLIVGTGCNATIPMALNKLHPSKRPTKVKVLDGSNEGKDLKIAVNTEWTIKGAAGPLRELNLITSWDDTLSGECEIPGFQPFEFMTAGRYLGELGRIIVLDYFTKYLQIPASSLPPALTQRHGLTTSFLGNLGPHLAKKSEPSMVKQLQAELPPAGPSWDWTEETAAIVYAIAKAVEIRASGLAAAAIIGLLGCADEIHLSAPLSEVANGNGSSEDKTPDVDELLVGYTGGCIVHFQDYLEDCQDFLDEIMTAEFGDEARVPRVVLQPCHDGGIIGAGILAGTVQSVTHDA